MSVWPVSEKDPFGLFSDKRQNVHRLLKSSIFLVLPNWSHFKASRLAFLCFSAVLPTLLGFPPGQLHPVFPPDSANLAPLTFARTTLSVHISLKDFSCLSNLFNNPFRFIN